MGVRAVFLVGFMGSGKSTVGQELARRLGWQFLDLDARIEAREAQTIPEIFRTKGEPSFRQSETSALRDLLSSDLLPNDLLSNEQVPLGIVALGGGAFALQKNRELLQEFPTVFLDASVDELWRRCQQDPSDRPLRQNRDQFQRLHSERLPHYRTAKITISTEGKDIPSICAEIENTFHLKPPDASCVHSSLPARGRSRHVTDRPHSGKES